MRSHSYINTAKIILQEYNGSQPFSNWLKSFFAGQKKYGSRDRKFISHICYSYFRLGGAFAGYTQDERMLIGLFLSSTKPLFILKELVPEWNEKIAILLEEKLDFLQAGAEMENLFPWIRHLSNEINAIALSTSLLIQPSLFLRIRPGKKNIIINKLKQAAIPFTLKTEECIELENSTKIEDVLSIDKEIVVQDFNSQQVLGELKEVFEKDELIDSWDCCAASGGKSILLKDLFPKAFLTVSDIRPSIMHNLRNRFQRAGIHHFSSMVLDVSKEKYDMDKTFDLIICDAPCSGSGTWGRTPEQLLYFDENKIDYYADLQKRISKHVSWNVKSGGYFLYITCSIFHKENEEVVDYLIEQTSLKLINKTYYTGFDQKADTLFTALFRLL